MQRFVHTKNLQIWYQKCFIWVFLKLKFEKTIVMFEISLQFFKIQIFMQNKRNFKCGTKNTLFGYFGAVTSTLEFVKNVFWVITVNFGIGSAFSKVPGPGPGPLCKVCSLYCLLEIMNKVRNKTNVQFYKSVKEFLEITQISYSKIYLQLLFIKLKKNYFLFFNFLFFLFSLDSICFCGACGIWLYLSWFINDEGQ